MLARWTELLPVFVVRWLARGRCERITVRGVRYETARPDLLIKVTP
jgi:hypothetical protein